MIRIARSSRLLLLTLATLLPLACQPPADHAAGHGAHEPEGAATATTPTPEAALTRVEPQMVCMINDQFMAKPQIPVVVGDATYYGCCSMCEAKLADDPASRKAIDPVSGNEVDKAVAVIGKTSTGAVLYFESEQNLAAWTPASKPPEHAGHGA